MRKQKYVCDSCGKEEEKSEFPLTWEVASLVVRKYSHTADAHVEAMVKEYDLCERCGPELKFKEGK